MKQFKKLLVLGVAVICMMSAAGCGTNAGQASNTGSEAASNTAEVSEKDVQETALEPTGMDGERIQGQGFTIGTLENWHESNEGLAEGFVGLKSDDYDSSITMHIEVGPAYTDIDRFETDLAAATGAKADQKGKAACGDYIIVDIPAMEYTEADLQAAVDAGSITQADIDNAGGMAAAVEMVNNQQAAQYQLYAPYKENNMFSITAGYDDANKADIKAAMIQVVESLAIEE